VEGGKELAAKLFVFDLWPQLKPQLLPFLNAVRAAISLPQITDLPS
jgi:putative ATP-dependent endonuclease of OLD family